MSLVFIRTKQEKCVFVRSPNTSEHSGQIVFFGMGVGQIWSRSPYVLTQQIKKTKVRIAQQRQMDAVTHLCTWSRASRQADTWLQIKRREGKRGVLHMSFCVSERQHKSMWTVLSVLFWVVWSGTVFYGLDKTLWFQCKNLNYFSVMLNNHDKISSSHSKKLIY